MVSPIFFIFMLIEEERSSFFFFFNESLGRLREQVEGGDGGNCGRMGQWEWQLGSGEG